jgi:hypothetical protein
VIIRWNHMVCMVNDMPPYCLGKWCIFIMIIRYKHGLGSWVSSYLYTWLYIPYYLVC